MSDLSNLEYPTEYNAMPGVIVKVNPTRPAVDAELLAISVANILLNTLDPSARARVVSYLGSRFG